MEAGTGLFSPKPIFQFVLETILLFRSKITSQVPGLESTNENTSPKEIDLGSLERWAFEATPVTQNINIMINSIGIRNRFLDSKCRISYSLLKCH